MSKLPKYCVYQYGWDEGHRDMVVGDGITAPAVLLVATANTHEEASRICETVRRHNRDNTGPLVPGSNRRVAQLEVDAYNPRDFVGRQERDNLTRVRFADLCGRLSADAKQRRDRLVAGNA